MWTSCVQAVTLWVTKLGNCLDMCPSQCPSQCPICAHPVYKLGHSLHTGGTTFIAALPVHYTGTAWVHPGMTSQGRSQLFFILWNIKYLPNFERVMAVSESNLKWLVLAHLEPTNLQPLNLFFLSVDLPIHSLTPYILNGHITIDRAGNIQPKASNGIKMLYSFTAHVQDVWK